MEATLAEIHGELSDRLGKIHGKPLMVTITHKDDNNKLWHWIGTNNEFDYADIEKTLAHLVTQADKDLKPRNIEVVKDIKAQFQVRKQATLRG